MPYSDYSYLDPLHIVWRMGTPEDPFVDRVEFLKVVNNKAVLAEIPDRFARVKISGHIEINYDGNIKKSISPNEFYVNYSTGIIELHESKNFTSINVSYKGRGFIQYPASRIYYQDGNIVNTLDKLIDEAKKAIINVDDKISDYIIIRDRLLEVILMTEIASAETKEATERANSATEKALDAYDTTRLVFKQYVNEYDDIAKEYSQPEVGWTVQVYSTGIRYRFDGQKWVAIDSFGGAIPKASEEMDGLMSSEDFVRLTKIDENSYNRRVIVFIIPSTPYVGKQGIIARFPFDGVIVGVKAICSVVGETETEISIEKTKDMMSWTKVSNRNLFIKPDKYFDDGTANFSVDRVDEGDMFRLDIIQQGVSIQNITVELIINTIKEIRED
ncbi:hypothetical protein BSK59_15410 [Paenibacillus odorifer]|uniref:hypothetical protein n=1 Tax=Paenibacillus odorifer TaxID=189426 RepID=UPI00096D34CF|nr:hypothetical protein [Paenibacillus odorifer]OME53967.1 hypothetical protein BSK59_15410 [Paenibacillus odorifer]